MSGSTLVINAFTVSTAGILAGVDPHASAFSFPDAATTVKFSSISGLTYMPMKMSTSSEDSLPRLMFTTAGVVPTCANSSHSSPLSRYESEPVLPQPNTRIGTIVASFAIP